MSNQDSSSLSDTSVPSAALFSPPSTQSNVDNVLADSVLNSVIMNNDTFDGLDGLDVDDAVEHVIYYSRPATVFAAVCAIIFTIVGIAGRKMNFKIFLSPRLRNVPDE